MYVHIVTYVHDDPVCVLRLFSMYILLHDLIVINKHTVTWPVCVYEHTTVTWPVCVCSCTVTDGVGVGF